MTVFLSTSDLLRASVVNQIPLNDVIPKDRLPVKLFPGGYILNMSDSMTSTGEPLPGTHWTAFWIPMKGGAPSYFDSFGVSPPRALSNALKTYSFSTKQIQNVESGICGYYALFFLWWMSKKGGDKRAFRQFLNMFSSKPEKNREILQENLKKYFPK